MIGMRLVSAVIPIAAALLAMSPIASAHFEGYSEPATAAAGPYNVLIRPRSSPVLAGAVAPLALTTYGPDGTAAPLEPRLNVTLPDGTIVPLDVTTLSPGYATATLRPTSRGNHTIGVALTDDAGTYQGATTLHVYPDLGVSIIPLRPELDVAANVPTTVRFQAVKTETGFPNTTITDLTIRIEQWSDDHTRLIETIEIPLRSEGASTWALDHHFPKRGMYHMSFRSDAVGIAYEDFPILHTFATDPLPEPTKATPMGPLLLVAATLVALSLRRR